MKIKEIVKNVLIFVISCFFLSLAVNTLKSEFKEKAKVLKNKSDK